MIISDVDERKIIRHRQIMNDSVISEWFTLNSDIIGPCTKYHENGVKALECIGIIIGDGFSYHGDYREWYDNGNKLFVCVYAEGKLNGLCQKWCEDGTQYSEVMYQNGRRNGEYREWFWDGKERIIANYVDGVRNGEYKSWYFNGNEHITATYVDGAVSSWQERDQSGNITDRPKWCQKSKQFFILT